MRWLIGKEKAWAALLGGGMATAANVLALWAVSSTGAFPSPGPEAIAGAVTGVVASMFAAAGAYIAANTPRPGDAAGEARSRSSAPARQPPDQPPAP